MCWKSVITVLWELDVGDEKKEVSCRLYLAVNGWIR